MENNLSSYRKSYDKSELNEQDIPNSPFDLFSLWFKEVEKAGGVEEVNAMTVSTIGTDGFPKSRVVLLKEYSNEGFVFYTNYNSEKGKAIANNPNVCISFFWPNLERQVIIKGATTQLSTKKSEDYFNVRPRGSKIGAWVSPQSTKINSRNVLESNVGKYTEEFEGKDVPKPPHWGGYIVKPVSIEFWQGRANRLHDRILFEKINESWASSRLAP